MRGKLSYSSCDTCCDVWTSICDNCAVPKFLTFLPLVKKHSSELVVLFSIGEREEKKEVESKYKLWLDLRGSRLVYRVVVDKSAVSFGVAAQQNTTTTWSFSSSFPLISFTKKFKAKPPHIDLIHTRCVYGRISARYNPQTRKRATIKIELENQKKKSNRLWSDRFWIPNFIPNPPWFDIKINRTQRQQQEKRHWRKIRTHQQIEIHEMMISIS